MTHTYVGGTAARDDASPLHSEETRAVDEGTGGMKGQKLAQLGGLPPVALMVVAEVSGYGAEKYGDRYNYLLGYKWSLSYDALQRHLHAFWAREDTDPQSGLLHLGHAAWHCLALIAYSVHKIGTDDRPTYGPKT